MEQPKNGAVAHMCMPCTSATSPPGRPVIRKRTYEGSREDRDHLPDVGGHHVADELLGVGIDDSALPNGHHLRMSRASLGSHFRTIRCTQSPYAGYA